MSVKVERQHSRAVRGDLHAIHLLPALSAGDRVGRQVGCRLHVCANSWRQTAAEVFSKPDLFLSTMCSVACYGSAARWRVEYGRVGDDPRPGQRRAVIESGSMGKLARCSGTSWDGRRRRQFEKVSAGGVRLVSDCEAPP